MLLQTRTVMRKIKIEIYEGESNMSTYDVLKNNLEKEISEFRALYNNMTSQQTYNDWYIIGFKEEYFEMLMSDFVDGRFSEKEISWLSSLDSPLAFLYEEWLSSDGAMDHDWDSMLDFVHTVYLDELRRDKQDLAERLKTHGATYRVLAEGRKPPVLDTVIDAANKTKEAQNEVEPITKGSINQER